MLIICNGVFKSGSTWLHAIVTELLFLRNIQVSRIDEKYTNNVKSQTSIVESKFLEFLENEDFSQNNYINKSHFFSEKVINKVYPDSVVFLFSVRDIKDSIVSHYFHTKSKYIIFSNFNFYYWTIGRLKAYEIISYNFKYKNSFSSELFFNFSDFKNDFDHTIRRIAYLLKLDPLTNQEVSIIKSKTSIKNMRNNIVSGKTHYYSTVKSDRYKLIRHGKIGESKYFFNKKKSTDIKNLNNFQASVFFKIVYFFLFTFRRKILKIE